MAERGGRGRGRRARGGGGGGGGSSSGGTPRGRSRGLPMSVRSGSPAISTVSSTSVMPAEHVQTIGVRRPGIGTAGRALKVITNHWEVTSAPDTLVYQYDAMTPSQDKMPARRNIEMVRKLQREVAPQIFNPPCAYDGRKIMYSTHKLPFTDDTATFDVPMGDPPSTTGTDLPARERRPLKIRLTKVAEVNIEVLRRYIRGQQSLDADVLSAITVLNVAVRMDPTSRYPFNSRSFFTDAETRDIGSGIVLWRGYFQSIRPAPGRMLVNLDISTGFMYRAGTLIDLALAFHGRPGNPNLLAPSRGYPDRMKRELRTFLRGVRVLVSTDARGGRTARPRTIDTLSDVGARDAFFMQGDRRVSVAQYHNQTYNMTLQYPEILCAVIGKSKAMIPFELCTVIPGQIMRKSIPEDKRIRDEILRFSTKEPRERLASIQAGLGVLAYGQSAFVRQFGIHVNEAQGPVEANARVLLPPTLQYGPGSKAANITPRDGAWNLIDKKLFDPKTINRWIIVIYEQKRYFSEAAAREMVSGLLRACAAVGMSVNERDPIIRWENAQGDVNTQLHEAGMECFRKNGNRPPELMVVVIPDHADDLYRKVKHFGDIERGVSTQCLKAPRCLKANQQFWANICLKINPKLGGINTIPDPRSVTILTDPRRPTIIMGADVMHPGSQSTGRPSYTSLVASVDSNTAKYVADCRAQRGRQEMIDDLEDMAKGLLELYMGYRKNVEKKPDSAPKRIIFFRDGVSEGEYEHVLEIELPALKRACAALKINPTITLLVVGKRHHVRLFPMNANEADRSGNCRAGTVVDTDIVHPLEFDFYLQSHGGLKGTSRSAHYHVLHDENAFTADALQSLCFALCHVYARATRSVSIPAPVYYADIVCARARIHFDPTWYINTPASDTVSADEAASILQTFKDNFRRVHANIRFQMYFT